MSFSNKRRFVAGAICPKCSEMDKLVVYNQEGKDYRECIACGFKDEMHFKPVARELETRVNLTEEEKNQVETVKIIPFEKP